VLLNGVLGAFFDDLFHARTPGLEVAIDTGLATTDHVHLRHSGPLLVTRRLKPALYTELHVTRRLKAALYTV
jgi:hypothetical protein